MGFCGMKRIRPDVVMVGLQKGWERAAFARPPLVAVELFAHGHADFFQGVGFSNVTAGTQ